MITPCGCKQVLVDSTKTIFDVCDNAGNPAFTESGSKALAVGVDTVNVTWGTRKASINYEFTDLSVENLLDPNPISIDVTVLSKSVTGFKVGLNGAPDTANYILNYNAYVKTL